jgi:hypothetical protein
MGCSRGRGGGGGGARPRPRDRGAPEPTQATGCRRAATGHEDDEQAFSLSVHKRMNNHNSPDSGKPA